MLNSFEKTKKPRTSFQTAVFVKFFDEIISLEL